MDPTQVGIHRRRSQSHTSNGQRSSSPGSNSSNRGSNDSGQGDSNSGGNSNSQGGGSSNNSNNSSNGNNRGTSTSTSSSSSSTGIPSHFPRPVCPFCVADNDPRIIYMGSWTLDGTGAITTHMSNSPGSEASFSFNGSGIVVFGTVPVSNDTIKPPTASYVIDAADPFVTMEPQAAHAIPNQPLFASSQLASNHEHTLKIKLITADTPFILDYLFLFPSSNITQDVVSALPSNSAVVTPTASVANSAKKTAAGTATSTDGTTFKIVAGVLGSLVALLLLIIGLFLLHRHRRRQARSRKVYPESRNGSDARETTIFTSTESIFRYNPSFLWSNSTRSARTGSDSNQFVPLPSPPLPNPLLLPLPAEHRHLSV